MVPMLTPPFDLHRCRSVSYLVGVRVRRGPGSMSVAETNPTVDARPIPGSHPGSTREKE